MSALFASDYPVTNDKVAFFRTHGYVPFEGVLDADELTVVRRGMLDALATCKGAVRDLSADADASDDGHQRILQMLNLWEHYPEIRRYVGHDLHPRRDHLRGGG